MKGTVRYDGIFTPMPLYQVIVMAVVQSLTEFLPISSTAHLALVPRLLGWNNPELNSLDFDIALHLGTLAAVIVYFFRDWVQLAGQGFGLKIGRDPAIARNRNLLWLLAAATVPVGIFGYLFKDQAEGPWRSSFVIGTMLIVVGIVMYLAERASHCKKDLGRSPSPTPCSSAFPRRSPSYPAFHAAESRCRPACSATSTATPPPASPSSSPLRRSPPPPSRRFWTSIKPAAFRPTCEMPFLVGVAVSAVTGWIVIAFFLRFLRTHTLRFFVYYRIVFGIIVIALAIFVRRTG